MIKLRRLMLTIMALISAASMISLFILIVRYSSTVLAQSITVPSHVTAPIVSAVYPATAPNDLDTSVVITGTGFTSVPTVTLGSIRLVNVGWISTSTLTATVPWGFDSGVYTLTVTNPGGQGASLRDAYTVTKGIGVWTSGGPYGGQILALSILPATPSTLFAAAVNGGLFRSTNAGETWELVLSDVGFNPSIAVASPPSDPPSAIYLASFGRDEQIYRSRDGGNVWLPVSVPNMSDIGRVFTHPLISNTVYAGGGTSGLFKSDNFGGSWYTITQGMTDTVVNALAFHPTDPLIIYAGTMSGNIFKSLDGGVNWAYFGHPDKYVGKIAINPFNPGEVWVCASEVGIWGNLWKYDSGAWTKITPGNGQENIVYTLIFDQQVPGTIWIGTNLGGFKSIDGGISWQPFTPSMIGAVMEMAVDPLNSQIVYHGYNGMGIYRTMDNGITWQQTNQGLAGIVPNSLTTEPGRPEIVYALADLSGVFKSINGGASWSQLPAYSKAFILVDPITPTRIYADYPDSGAGGGVMISEDAGNTWREVVIQPPLQYITYTLQANVLAAHPLSPGHLTLGVIFLDLGQRYTAIAGAIYTSADFGNTWSYVDPGQNIGPVADLAVNPVNPLVIYAATNGTGVLKSNDGGATWQPRNAGLQGLPIEKVEVEPSPPYRVFAAYGSALFVSLDEGLTWLPRNVPPFGLYGSQVLFASPGNPAQLYLANGLGVFRSLDGAQTWQRAAGPLGAANAHSMTAIVAAGRIIVYVGTASSSVGGRQLVSDTLIGSSDQIGAGVYRITQRSYPIFLPQIHLGTGS